MPRREFKGAAAPTRLSAGIGTGDTSFTINSNAGWPTGGANGAFYVTLDPGTADEERVLVGSQAGGLCSSVTRGVDNTSAKSHGAGSDGTVIHSSAAVDYDEANRHIFVTTDDNHTQYMRTDGTRHDLTARHSAGSVVPTATAVAATVGDVAAEGGGTNLARSTHTHGHATGTPVSIGTANAAGASGSFPRLDHVHAIGAGAINSSGMFAAGVVDSAALAAAAVIAGKIAAGGVTATNQITDAIITLAKFASEASTDWAPAAADFATGATLSLGTGGTRYGHYFKLGRIVVGWCGWNMAADGNLPSPGVLVVPLPIAMRTTGADGFRCFVAARIRQAADGSVASGTGVITSGSSISSSLVTAGASAQWDSGTPFNLGTPGNGAGSFDALFAYETAT